MHKAAHLQNSWCLRVLPHRSSRRTSSSQRSEVVSGLQSSSSLFPEKRQKVKSSRANELRTTTNEELRKAKKQEHIIDFGDERSDLLGCVIYSGKLALTKRCRNVGTEAQVGSYMENGDNLDVKLTRKALIWGKHLLRLDDVVSVSYQDGLRHFTLHAYPNIKRCFMKAQRGRKDLCFVSSTTEDAIRWVNAFADQQCFVNLLPRPIVSSGEKALDIVSDDPFLDCTIIKSRAPPKVLVILNPRSGHGRSSKVFYEKVAPIFKLAGFQMEVVKTNSAGHAKKLASTVDFRTCPDGIICVGGDGIVNEVLNGLLSRDDKKEPISIPIGIIPAGSDNSLAWTVLGVRDPISAALAIVKGGLTSTDVFAVEWIRTGVIHFGSTVSYFGFLSDVLELSEKYQKRFGPLRYFVAGFLRFLCLPAYNFELEYLPMSKEELELQKKLVKDDGKLELSDLYIDIMRSNAQSIPRASSLSSIDSIRTPRITTGGDIENVGYPHSGSAPVESKTKHFFNDNNNPTTDTDWLRTASRSRAERTSTGPAVSASDSRTSWAAGAVNDKEDISSTMSDPGPIWDAEPKWDAEHKWDTEGNWEIEKPIHLPLPRGKAEEESKLVLVPSLDEKWVVKKGQFLGILVCNHSCKTVQSLSSQVVAPKAEHDDRSLDLLLVHGSGRFNLLRFFISLQFGKHISLPYVEYCKVKSVKVKPGKRSHNGCGVDGELLAVNGPVLCSLLPKQCRLIGRPARDHGEDITLSKDLKS